MGGSNLRWRDHNRHIIHMGFLDGTTHLLGHGIRDLPLPQHSNKRRGKFSPGAKL